MKNEISITGEKIVTLFDSDYVRVFDLQYAPGKHYYNASRRTLEDLAAAKSDSDFREMLPDAVSCIVILEMPGEEPRLLLSYEYRYPVGRYLLSVPAGLIDEKDKKEENPIAAAAVREIREETGLEAGEADCVAVVNPLLFSTPGMTDESNALVCVRMHPEDLSVLSREGAEESEQFDGFVLLTKAEALELLKNGRDQRGNYYPMFTWAAMMYFAVNQ